MKKNTKAVILVLTILAIVVTTGSLFTTISNPTGTDVAPVFEQTFRDGLGNEIPDIHSATISGTVSFTAVVTNVPNPQVENVRLIITYEDDTSSAGATTFGTYDFVCDISIDRPTYELELDTTTIPNGEYTFTFSYSVAGESSYVTFSSLFFNFEDGDGTSSSSVNMLTMLILAGAGVIVVIYVYQKRK